MANTNMLAPITDAHSVLEAHTATEKDEPDHSLHHIEKSASDNQAPTTDWKSWQNNAARQWWQDGGLRLCMLNIFILFGSIYANGYDSAVMSSLQANVNWIEYFDNPEGSLLGAIVSAYAFPVLVFPFLGSYLADRVGRKPVLFVASLFGIAGPLLSALGNSIGTFIAGRLLTGVGCSFFQVTAPTLIAEIAHPRFRAVVSAFYLCTYYIGSVLCAWIGLGMVQWGAPASWRVITALQCLGVIPLAIWSALPWSSESPRYLVKQGKKAQALAILAQLHANGDESDELVQNELQEIVLAIEMETAADRTSYLEFGRTPGNRKRFWLVLWFSWAQSMSGNNIFASYLPKTLILCGITSFTQIQALIAGLLMWLGVVSYICAAYVERIGRRPLVLWSGALLVVFFAIMTGCTAGFVETGRTSLGVAAIPMIFIGLSFYCSAMVPLPYLYITEILPYKLRSKGLAIFSFVTGVFQVFNAYVNAIALDAIEWRYYVIFVCTDLVQVIIAYFIIVETKGLTLEDIAVLFDGADSVLSGERAGVSR